MKKTILFLTVFLPVLCFGQRNSDTARFDVSVTPQYLIVNAARADVLVRTSSQNWVGLGIEYYYGSINSDNSADGTGSTVVRYNTPHNADALSGTGFTLYDKIFFKPGTVGYNFNLGACYSPLQIKYQDNAWVTSQENGSTYYHFALANGNLNIQRESFYAAFGYTSFYIGYVSLDVDIGGVFKYATVSSSGLTGDYRNYTRNIFDYAATGFFPYMALRFGYAF